MKLTDKDRMWLADLRAEQLAEGIDLSNSTDAELARSSWFAYYRLGRACQELKQVLHRELLDSLAGRLFIAVARKLRLR